MKNFNDVDEYSKWNMLRGDPIIGLPALLKEMDYVKNKRTLIVTSGGFDPLHPGHISVFSDCRIKTALHMGNYSHLDSALIVLVNSDQFLINKKGKAFMPQKVRCQSVSMTKPTKIVVPFNPSDPNDMTVCEALELIKPDVFAKGGDRTGIENIPEWQVCKNNDIEIVTGCGDDKVWSSSNFLKDWEEFVKSKEQ